MIKNTTRLILLVFVIVSATILAGCANHSTGTDSESNDAEALHVSTGKTVLFEPDVEDVISVSTPELIEAEGVLKRRLERADYKGFEVSRDERNKTVTAKFAEAISYNDIEEIIKPARVIGVRDSSGEVLIEADDIAYSTVNVFETDEEIQHVTLHLLDSFRYSDVNFLNTGVYMNDTKIAEITDSSSYYDLIFAVECTHEEAKELTTEIDEGLRLPLRIISIEE